MTSEPELRLAWAGPRSFEDVRAIFEEDGDGRVFYGANTCWWSVRPDDLYTHRQTGLPCDPRGGMLLETQDLDGWLAAAVANSAHYGPFGTTAFLAAYHLNVMARWRGPMRIALSGGAGGEVDLAQYQDGAWLATCLETWQQYTTLLDAWREVLGQQIERAEHSLAAAPADSPLVARLAHARSEWALHNLLVCDHDLEQLRFLGIEHP